MVARAAIICCLLLTSSSLRADEFAAGRTIYAQRCAMCHGNSGEGVADKYDEALYGKRSLAELIQVIDETMPAEHADQCTGEDARQVGQFIYHTFYTATARAKNNPPRIELSHLTVRQCENAIADLVGSFGPQRRIGDNRGLKGEYFNEHKHNGGQRKMDRVDAQVDFRFGTKSPHEAMKDNDFSIRWRGSILIDETGEYEFGVKTENGFQLWVNDKDNPLIDGYVAAGPEPTQRNGTTRLLGGRAYPFELEWFKYKDRTASVQLLWKPPGKSWQLIPQRNLSPDDATPALVIRTPFPADDGSLGYPRGTDVSQAWDEATTYAAIEVANAVMKHLPALTGVKKDAPDRRQKLEAFCSKFSELAFRRPLTDEQRQQYVDSQFTDGTDLDLAVKRSVIMTLKSPYFLYVSLPRDGGADSYDAAARLSLALWDSLPDESLRNAAARNELRTSEMVMSQARRMVDDPRAKAKLRGFFAQWLQLNHTDHLAKDSEVFAGFDEDFIGDLRTSLDLFVDDVIDSPAADYRQLLLADYWYVNERIAKFYGLGVAENGKFEKVSLDATQRAGVVTHPYILASLSYHDTTSPIHRGVFASRRLLSRPLNPPPNAILFENTKFDPHLTMREKVTELTKAETCMTCHSTINPLGFSLENFDAVGRHRMTERDKPINAASDFTTAGGETIRLTSGRDLAEYAVASEQAQRGFVEQLFHHTVKQPAAAYGEKTLEELHKAFVDSQYNIRELLIQIAVKTS